MTYDDALDESRQCAHVWANRREGAARCIHCGEPKQERTEKDRTERGDIMKVKLLKDILIPAGTIFEQAPTTVRYSSPHAEYIIGFGDDSCGSLIVPIEPESEEWFESLSVVN